MQAAPWYSAALSVAMTAAFSCATYAQDVDAYWAKEESFGIGVEKDGDSYPIITFIPRSFLLFNLNRTEPELKVGKNFTAVTTQDGIRLFVLSATISKNKVKDALGAPSLIFNAEHRICRPPQGASECDEGNPDDLVTIAAGEVFAASKVDEDTTRLTGTRNQEEVAGQVRQDKLDELHRSGVITLADLNYPRLSIDRIIAQRVRTKCGELREARDQDIGGVMDGDAKALNDADRLALEDFDLGSISEDAAQFSITYAVKIGAENEEYEFRSYRIVDHQQNDQESSYVAQVIYQCERVGTASVRKFIKSVVIKKQGASSNIVLGPWGTPTDLISYTKAPYLFSVNSSRHYFDLMSKLGELFGNRALAGYFLSEFNRSCISKHRERPDCAGYQIQ